MRLNLKRTGYFREMSHGEASDPSIIDSIGKKELKGNIKNRICNYLNSGVVIVACYGTSQDVIKPEKGAAGCPSMMTDGTWVWPGDLSYYVSSYSLGVNPDFLSFMVENNWSVPITEDSLDFDQIEIDGQPLID